MCQHVVLLVDLVSQFTDIFYFSFLLLISQIVESADGMDNAVNKGHRGIDKRHLGTLLQVATLVSLNVKTRQCQILTALLQQFIEFITRLVFLSLVQVVKKPEHENEQHNGHQDNKHHDVLLRLCLAIHISTSLQLTVLTGLLLQVEIYITVLVTGCLVVKSSIRHRKLFPNAGHKVGRLINLLVRQRHVQVVERCSVIVHGMITGCQRSIGTCNLIHVTIL